LSTSLRRLDLPWWEPWTLCRLLAGELGADGLVLLEGDGSPLGLRAVLGVAPLEQVRCHGLPQDPEGRDPFAALSVLEQAGGPWLGWLTYEAAAWVEPAPHWRRPAMATLWAARHDPLIHFDRRRRRCWLEGRDPARLATLAQRIEALAPAPVPTLAAIAPEAWHWHTPVERFAAQVERLQAWIAAGDLFQANLTACCETRLADPPDPLALYARLRRHCPAPFAGLAIGGEEAVVSASPERFLRCDPQGLVETRPIKGTRPRHGDPLADAAAAADLVSNPKDRAENVMIVDLLRNDLGRVCRPGSIQVPQLVGLESYAQVHHLTSVVTGELAVGQGPVSLLRACWPGGSISGAPKLRACRRLAELEPVPRGAYCGSLIHLDAHGGLDSSILIRSLMVQGRRLWLQAGCGIVADSDPQEEARELGWKLLPMLEALA